MRIVRRKLDQSIVIGEGAKAITIKVIRVKNGQCQLGVTAPPEVLIREAEKGRDRESPSRPTNMNPAR